MKSLKFEESKKEIKGESTHGSVFTLPRICCWPSNNHKQLLDGAEVQLDSKISLFQFV